MRCRQHPSMTIPPGQTECFLCGELTGTLVESDRRKFELERMSRLMTRPGERPVSFRSTSAYQRHLKQRGLTDDIGHRELRRAIWDDGKRLRHQAQTIKQFTTRLDPAMRQRDARWVQQHGRSA